MITIYEFIKFKQPWILNKLLDPRDKVTFKEWKRLMETPPGFDRRGEKGD